MENTKERTNLTAARHAIVSENQWIEARKVLLEEEKKLSRLSDALAAKRRALPWVKVDKNYMFNGPDGKVSLSDLFDGNSQLIIYHFMYAPGWEAGCTACSFMADHIDGVNHHLPHHDVSVAVVSRAPYEELVKYRKRMGWKFKWVSSFDSDFNYDYHVTISDKQVQNGEAFYNFEKIENAGEGELPGTSVFFKDIDGQIYHTYSCYARGGDMLLGTHNFLDLTPKGRNEEEIMDWLRRHDEYADTKPGSCCH